MSKEEEDKCVAGLWRELVKRMYETLGGYSGHMTLGLILAYGAGPELFDRYGNQFPGLWLHGETGQGKTSTARWLMRIWGFLQPESKKNGGFALKDSTKVGMAILLQQYGNLPVWLEEFQIDCADWVLEKIKNIYDRVSGGKKNFAEGGRKIRTNAMVTGIATGAEAQVKSRYAHIQVAEQFRMAEHFDWFEVESPDFFFLGRYVLRNRKEFVRLVFEAMKVWDKNHHGMESRARYMHGVAFAAFAALSEMLGTGAEVEVER